MLLADYTEVELGLAIRAIKRNLGMSQQGDGQS